MKGKIKKKRNIRKIDRSIVVENENIALTKKK